MTLSVFPGVTAAVRSTSTNDEFNSKWFVPICTFLVYNIGDTFGRFLTSIVQFPHRDSTFQETRSKIKHYSQTVNNRKLLKFTRYNPHTSVTLKVADKVVFRRFQGKGLEFFFNRTSLTPSQIFVALLLANTNSSFNFSVTFYIKICFESDGFIPYPYKCDWREKRCLFTLKSL